MDLSGRCNAGPKFAARARLGIEPTLTARPGAHPLVGSMHLVDTTLFYSPTSGGVKRYLTAKHAWLGANTSWKHTILGPGDVEHIEQGAVSSVPGYPWPGPFNYRLPLNPRRWARLLDQLEPDLIEEGDAFHPAWCAW